MREIKFKVWDKKYGHFNDIILELPRELNEDWTGLNYGDLVLLQYTGLKDKNGKEIYEGDFIQNDMGELASIIYSGKRFTTQHADIPKGDFEWEDDDTNCNFTVIGNIYENPDLISK
jgi:hypothetical protein